MQRIFNSLTGKKETLKPLQPGRVGLYVCGITVYDECHLGHARFMVVFDVVVRHLRAEGLEVTYVRNITDIDDKIIRRAAESGMSIEALTEKYIGTMHRDTEALGLLAPDIEPRATAHMDDIIAMISRLIDNGHAYRADNGDVYYDVSSFKQYGALSHKKLDELRVGARISVDEAKDDALDFVLWKAAKPDEPSWDSPWGAGRPGWHIECSAMSTRCLGEQFDIHGGGMDLKFPHHENEIAQSEAATGKRFVNLWMHNGFVQVGEDKMSKSLGNFQTIDKLLGEYRGEEVKFFILSSHYRSPLAYTSETMDSACHGLRRLYTALRGLDVDAEPEAGSESEAAFVAAMNDDFNTPAALSVLFEIAHAINAARETDTAAAAAHAALLRRLGARLGLLAEDPDQWLRFGGTSALSDDAVEALIAERDAAREQRDWAEADRIRDALQEAGVLLEDSAGGTTWTRSRS